MIRPLFKIILSLHSFRFLVHTFYKAGIELRSVEERLRMGLKNRFIWFNSRCRLDKHIVFNTIYVYEQ